MPQRPYFDENQKEIIKKKSKLKISIVVLSIIVIILGSFIVWTSVTYGDFDNEAGKAQKENQTLAEQNKKIIDENLILQEKNKQLQNQNDDLNEKIKKLQEELDNFLPPTNQDNL